MRLYDFLLYARDEGKVSKFRPHDFELDISKTDDITPYKIDIDDGLTVTLKGKIDRVDCYETENDNYIRVVDYKTGKKDFSIRNIVNGLDLQMFIYLFALIKNGKDHFAKELKPAAVMYIKNFLDAAEEDLLKETKEKSITNGLFLNDNSLLSAMDSSCDSSNPSKYIPVSYKKDGSISSKSPVVDVEKFKQLEKYVTDALNSIVCDIYSGNVTVSPLEESDKSKSKCDYCKFENVCGRSYKSKRKLKSGDWDEIEKGVFDCNDN
jgi:ATP-dependent helicase/nuclease subunit B